VLWELYTTLVGEFSPTGVFRVYLFETDSVRPGEDRNGHVR
jgi:hypothetical protein